MSEIISGHRLRSVLLALFLLGLMVAGTKATAVASCTNTISSVPATLSIAGAVYCLTSDINSGSGSINIAADNITIDGQGHAVNVSSDLMFNLAVSGTSIKNTTVRNIRLLHGGVLTNGGAGVISSGSYWRVSAWVQDALIENSTFRNTRTDGYPMNQLYMWRRLTFRNNTVEFLNSFHNMLQLQYTIDSLFENNSFKFTITTPNSQESFGWNIRDTSSRNTFRNNLLVENGKADICFGSQADARGLQDTDGTVVVNHPYNGDNIFQNNVIVSLPNTIGSFRIGGTLYATLTSGNNTFTNNIMYAVGNYALGLNDSIDSLGTLNHNTLVNTDGITSYVIMDVNGGSSTSVFTNNILYGKAGNSIGPGSSNNLIAVDPKFVGPLPTWSDLTTADDIVAMGNAVTAAVHLQGSSPAKNAGNDGKDEGVDFAALGSGSTCTESWTCGAWSACSGGNQSRTCTDANNCGTTTSRPALTQSCTTPDTTLPTVSITAPANNATVSGTITVSATASDNIGVAGVTFYASGVVIGVEDTTAPYSVSWNTAAYANGSAKALTAVARDAAGNVKTSTAVNVTVQQPACVESWSCGAWGQCSGGSQSRTCLDSNGCGTTASRPPLSQGCSIPDTTPPAAVSDLRAL